MGRTLKVKVPGQETRTTPRIKPKMFEIQEVVANISGSRVEDTSCGLYMVVLKSVRARTLRSIDRGRRIPQRVHKVRE